MARHSVPFETFVQNRGNNDRATRSRDPKEAHNLRTAAIAGILFALLFSTGVVLIRISIPADPAAESTWLKTNSRTVALALNLVPYAGIAFLWFIGVIRDRLGDKEDILFATMSPG